MRGFTAILKFIIAIKSKLHTPGISKFVSRLKLEVLNPNPWSEISYQEIFKNFQNEAVN